MQKALFSPAKRHVLQLACLLLSTTAFFDLSMAQSPPAANPPGAFTLPVGASSKKVDEFLATLKPPTTTKALLSGNDLLLDVPDIASAGPLRAKVVSTIPRTDGMWLLTAHPM